MSVMSLALGAVERGWIPDSVTRRGIRRLCQDGLRQRDRGSQQDNETAVRELVEELRQSPVALVPEKANQQHYEVPARFFELVLGKHRKYSCCLWDDATTLDEAEAAALQVTCERAGLRNGMEILELGCGWGSLTLWMAEHFPDSQITAVSNSSSQRVAIYELARARGLSNVTVITSDMNQFDAGRKFDRVVSVEMFEHMRNYEVLLKRIASWLYDEGQLFVHIFTHRNVAYPFESRSDADWMARYFFTGGLMPSEDLLLYFQNDLKLVNRWKWSGIHYEKTSNAWLEKMDAHRAEILPIMAATYGQQDARCWLNRWRVFFLACAELFGYHDGEEWGVSHYLFAKSQIQLT